MRPDFHGVSRPVRSWPASSGQRDDQSAEFVPDSGFGPSFAQKEISGLNRYESSHAERSHGCFFMFRQVNSPVILIQIAGFVHVCRTGDEVRLPMA